ncbi:hypothetical protein BCCGELA001_08465 [Bradyrhizobium sp. CCGE-LA001]|nr:hypothetical protein BCCGELA001_08465 [Bradyrhizobium sp. CCGE-LA001]
MAHTVAGWAAQRDVVIAWMVLRGEAFAFDTSLMACPSFRSPVMNRIKPIGSLRSPSFEDAAILFHLHDWKRRWYR